MRSAEFLIALSVVVVAATFTASFADAEEGQLAPLALFVNEVETGDTSTVLIRDDAHILVPRGDLVRAGLVHLPGQCEETVDGKIYVALARLAPKVSIHFDERALTLHITAPPEFFATTVISLLAKAPAGIAQYRDTGLFLNYAPRLVDLKTPGASGEAGLSVGGVLLFSAVSYAPPTGVLRGLTNITVDEPQSLQRWVVGDAAVSSGGPLSGSAIMGAVTLGRAFQLDPYFVQAPLAHTSGTVSSPSTLEVYVNGLLVRRETLNPGSYALQNIPLTTGQGTTRYVVRDSFGRESQAISNFYFSSVALAKGISDYSFSAGAIRQNLAFSSFDYGGGYALLGSYRVGVSDNVTLGFRGEATLAESNTRPSGGPTLTWVVPAGQFDLSVAGSMTRQGNGAAASGSYVYNSRTFSAGIVTRLMSKQYSNVSQGPLDNRDLIDANVNVSVPVMRWATFSTVYTLAKSRDSGLSGRMGVQASFIVSRDISINGTAGRTYNSDGTAPFDALISMNVQLGHNVSGALSAQYSGSQGSTEVDLSKPAPTGTGVGGRLAVTQSSETHVAVGATGQFQYGQTEMTADYLTRQFHSTIGIAGALVIVPKTTGFYLTRPVQDGYAVIQVPGAGNVRGYLSNSEVGRTDSRGNLLVPNLLSYYGNVLSINDSDLPFDYLIDGGQQIAATSFRGPAIVRFDAKKTSFVRGIVTIRRGAQDVIPAYGELTLTFGRVRAVSPLARLGEFEFESLAAGTYSALVEYSEGECRFVFVVPAPAGPVADVGTIQCMVP